MCKLQFSEAQREQFGRDFAPQKAIFIYIIIGFFVLFLLFWAHVQHHVARYRIFKKSFFGKWVKEFEESIELTSSFLSSNHVAWMKRRLFSLSFFSQQLIATSYRSVITPWKIAVNHFQLHSVILKLIFSFLHYINWMFWSLSFFYCSNESVFMGWKTERYGYLSVPNSHQMDVFAQWEKFSIIHAPNRLGSIVFLSLGKHIDTHQSFRISLSS